MSTFRLSRTTVITLALPLVVFGLVGGAFALWKPNILVSTLGSLQALAISAAVVVLTLLLTWVVWRATRRPWAGVLAGLIPVVLFLTYTIAPVFRDTTLTEAPPVALPTATISPGPGAPSTAAVIGTAELAGIDHRASGAALVTRTADGRVVVRFENLDVEPGPDYQVHIVPGADQTSGGMHLGALRANRGAHNYAVPADTEVSTPLTVLIWCRAFAVPIANATITG